MARTINAPRRATLVSNIAITLAIAVVANGAYAALGLIRANTERWPAFAPPGHTIGIIWVVLFAGMGAARWYAINSRSPHTIGDTRAIAGLVALCLAYPPYTHIIGGHAIELVGNAVTFAYAAWLTLRLRAHSATAALLIAAVAGWVAFATVLVFALVQLNGWST
jgi:tryptophan-rich sensory protein